MILMSANKIAEAPVSDGTMRCPEAHEGMPCQKRIPNGWTASEGHAGGHWFQHDDSYSRIGTDHYDRGLLLSGQPTPRHRPEDCPDPVGCPLRPVTTW
jgi:hypothetical protein